MHKHIHIMRMDLKAIRSCLLETSKFIYGKVQTHCDFSHWATVCVHATVDGWYMLIGISMRDI